MPDKDFPWPKKGVKAFKEMEAGLYRTLACINWSGFRDDGYAADAFKESGDVVVTHIVSCTTHEHGEFYLRPVLFLYRHAMELKMKGLIRTGLRLGLLQKSPKLEEQLGEHKLYPLWNHVREVAVALYPNGDKETLGNAESIVQQIHHADPTGQESRYAQDKNGNEHLQNVPSRTDLLALKDACDRVFAFYDGIDASLDDYNDCLGHASDHYSGE